MAEFETGGTAFAYTYRPKLVNKVFNVFLNVKAQTFRSSTQTQIFEIIVFVSGYKNGPSLRTHIDWKKPLSIFLVLTKRKADFRDEF